LNRNHPEAFIFVLREEFFPDQRHEKAGEVKGIVRA
jgi:hypothetical protein